MTGRLKDNQRKSPLLKSLLIVVSGDKGNLVLEYEDPCSFGYGRHVARDMGAHYLSAENIIQRGVIKLPL